MKTIGSDQEPLQSFLKSSAQSGPGTDAFSLLVLSLAGTESLIDPQFQRVLGVHVQYQGPGPINQANVSVNI